MSEWSAPWFSHYWMSLKNINDSDYSLVSEMWRCNKDDPFYKKTALKRKPKCILISKWDCFEFALDREFSSPKIHKNEATANESSSNIYRYFIDANGSVCIPFIPRKKNEARETKIESHQIFYGSASYLRIDMYSIV